MFITGFMFAGKIDIFEFRNCLTGSAGVSNQKVMKSNDIILAVVILAAVGISLYRKYLKKEKGKQSVQKPAGTGSFHSVRDDYEPYSGKYPGSGSGKQDA
ncbi:MAG TPA: hypothetical protein DCY25_12605 [Bacteroidales bacterium]|nr:hypothetical protein [Bacteroidales bacterium]